MNFQTAIITCFKKCVKFEGRASKYEFWYFTLFFYGVITLIMFASYFEYKFLSFDRGEFQSDLSFGDVGFYWEFIYGFILVSLLPYLSVTVRRLHDINKSGKWVIAALLFTILSGFIPFVGLLSLITNLIIFFMCLSYASSMCQML